MQHTGQSVLHGLGKEPLGLKVTEINHVGDLFKWLTIVMVIAFSAWPVCCSFGVFFKLYGILCKTSCLWANILSLGGLAPKYLLKINLSDLDA